MTEKIDPVMRKIVRKSLGNKFKLREDMIIQQYLDEVRYSFKILLILSSF